MADLSNRALALLLVVAIVVSVSGTLTSLYKLQAVGSPTGAAISNGTGTTTFEIDTNFSIKFVNNVLPFGTGTVIGGGPCSLNSSSDPTLDANCLGFNATLDEANLTIENDGNVLANVSLNFSTNASTLIGGTAPNMTYEVTNNETSSCGQLMNGTSWTTIQVITGEQTAAGVRVCQSLNYVDASDTLEVAIGVLLPEDAATGARTLTIWALGCDDGSC